MTKPQPQNSKKIKGWIILNSRNAVDVSKLIGKIRLTISRGDYLGRQKIRVSSKVIEKAYDLIEKHSQRIRI